MIYSIDTNSVQFYFSFIARDLPVYFFFRLWVAGFTKNQNRVCKLQQVDLEIYEIYINWNQSRFRCRIGCENLNQIEKCTTHSLFFLLAFDQKNEKYIYIPKRWIRLLLDCSENSILKDLWWITGVRISSEIDDRGGAPSKPYVGYAEELFFLRRFHNICCDEKVWGKIAIFIVYSSKSLALYFNTNNSRRKYS